MNNLTLTKAEQNLINRVNNHGGIKKYKNWIAYNIADRRYRFKELKSLDNLIKKLKENSSLHLLKS